MSINPFKSDKPKTKPFAAMQLRPSAYKRGYGRRWQEERAGWLRQHPLCGDRLIGNSDEHSLCLKLKRITAAQVVDHIIPHRGDMELFWNNTNWQSLCDPCHNKKTFKEIQGGGGV